MRPPRTHVGVTSRIDPSGANAPWGEVRDRSYRTWGKRIPVGPLRRRMHAYVTVSSSAPRHERPTPDGLPYAGQKFSLKTDDGFTVARGGVAVEDLTALVKTANAELEQSRAQLQELVNQLANTGELLGTQLIGQINELRGKRMAMVTETREMLSALQDLRKFFLSSAHEEEIKRVVEFAALCRELQELKASGFLDAVADVMLKLAERPAPPSP